MDVQALRHARDCVPSAIRSELARLGLTKADLDRKRTSLDELARDVFRMLAEGRGRIDGVVREVLDRHHLGSPAVRPER